MRRCVVLLAVAFIGLAAMAQPETSLTPEFAGLSAKERARLAKKEAEEAAQDARFQTVMAEAESLFKQRRYDESLTLFEQARSLRPLNVYPKVKIQDLQALIAKREAESLANDPELQEPRAPLAEAVVQSQSGAQESPPVNEPLPDSIEPPVMQREVRTVVKPYREQPKRQEPGVAGIERRAGQVDGLKERTFVEGRAIVIERRLVRGGVEAVFRKVSHPWGQVVHFRDGNAISEREWTSVFGGQ